MEATSKTKKNIWGITLSEWKTFLDDFRGITFGVSLILAIACVLIVIVGNVVLLIAVNFWLVMFPKFESSTNAGQIAVQVIVSVFLVMLFSTVGVAYIVTFGVRPLWHALTDTNRMRGPLYRLLLLFASGATNALTGILGTYAMLHTPQFIQAVLLSVVPFCAQAWTYLLVPNERERRYRSLTLATSFVFFVVGVLLSSMSSFIEGVEKRPAAPRNWTLIYFASAIVFGLWCVVQRLYLDAIMFRGNGTDIVAPCTAGTANAEDPPLSDTAIEKTAGAPSKKPLFAQREWGKQNQNDLAAKTVLLLVGIFFQALVSFVCIPVDALPWFGTTTNIADSWRVFRGSVNFMFASWHNVRYGILHTFGLFMSFIGCTYLNERSPTLASVVLQLAAPVTGLVLIIAPEWNVYGEVGIVGHKIGGVILLAIGGIVYHVWDQATVREMISKYNETPSNGEEEEEHQQQPQQEQEQEQEARNADYKLL